jgi:hypothetical protein
MSLVRKLIRADGTSRDLDGPHRMELLRRLIGADTIDTVQLRHMGRPLHVMLVDDTGMVDGKPVNDEATKLYWQNCRPGTTHPICGEGIQMLRAADCNCVLCQLRRAQQADEGAETAPTTEAKH